MPISISAVVLFLSIAISFFTGKHFYDNHQYIQQFYTTQDLPNAIMDKALTLSLSYPLLLFIHREELFVHAYNPLHSIRSHAKSSESSLHHLLNMNDTIQMESKLWQLVDKHVKWASNWSSLSVALCSQRKDSSGSELIYESLYQFSDKLNVVKISIDDGDDEDQVVDALMRCKLAMHQGLEHQSRSNPLNYKINLVLASEGGQYVSGQSPHKQAFDVVTKQLVRSIDQLLAPNGAQVHIVKQRHSHTGLSDRYNYRGAVTDPTHQESNSSSHHTVVESMIDHYDGNPPYSYLLNRDIYQYMDSKGSIYHILATSGSGCMPSQLCSEITIVYYVPILGHRSMHIIDSPSSLSINHNGSDDSSMRQDYLSSGSIHPRHGCFILFDFSDDLSEEASRNNYFHSVLDLSLQCLRSLFDILELRGDSDRGTPYSFSRLEIDQFHVKSMMRTLQATHKCMRQSLALEGLQPLIDATDVIDAARIVAASIYLISSNSYRAFHSLLSEYYQLMKTFDNLSDLMPSVTTCLIKCEDKDSCSCRPTAQSLMTIRAQLIDQLRSARRSCHRLTSDPDGALASRSQLPMELYFAVYGPYWLPLLLPAYRLIRTYL